MQIHKLRGFEHKRAYMNELTTIAKKSKRHSIMHYNPSPPAPKKITSIIKQKTILLICYNKYKTTITIF